MNGAALDKSKRFAVRVVRLYTYLMREKREFVMSKQLLKCGTSLGANLAEAECAYSRAEFLSKMYIAFKETMETLYWLDILHETGFLTDEQLVSVRRDCEELRKLLSSITKTTRGSHY